MAPLSPTCRSQVRLLPNNARAHTNRFANPASLNGATSWVFLNSPDNIQHVCATNVRNYGRRYLPDIYKFVTHEKGILGSQVRARAGAGAVGHASAQCTGGQTA